MSDQEINNKLIMLAAPKFLGGYLVDHVTVHADLFLLKPVMRYIKYRFENIEFTPELYFVEYHIGLRLSQLFKLKVNNSTPHTDQPCEVYSHIFETIKWFRITHEELVKGSVGLIYKRIILQSNQVLPNYNYNRIFCNVLPSYLQSFNFKLHNNFLPVNTLFRHYALDNETTCYFCNVGPESIFHVFGSCEKLKVLWKIASIAIENVTNKHMDMQNLRINLLLDFVKVNLNMNRKFEKMVVYFNSIINFSIWKMRNQIKFEFKNFAVEKVVGKIIRSIRARKNVDSKMTESKRIPFLMDLLASFMNEGIQKISTN